MIETPDSLDDCHMSQHAIGRALDMLIGGDEIRDAVSGPDHVYITASYPDRVCMRRGRIAVVVAREHKPTPEKKPWAILTVLWSSRADWEADYQLPQAEGREPRW